MTELLEQAEVHESYGYQRRSHHRQILEQALMRPKKKSFLDVLKEMPNVGRDSDFERIQQDATPEVFS